MKPSSYVCHCCGAAKSTEQFNPGRFTCVLCSGLPAYDAVEQTRATLARERIIRERTQQGKKDARRELKLAKYAEHGKRCASCWHPKPVGDYDVCKPRSDGLQSNCKACNRLYVVLRASDGMPLWRKTREALRASAPPTNVIK